MSSDETKPETVPIPGPPGLPLVGNAFDIDTEFPLGSMLNFANEYGEIFRLNFPGRNTVFVGSQKLIHELCDEKRFHKTVSSALNEVRHGIHDGLFTARIDEPNWGIAHRILMPAFGPMAIQNMFPEMHEIASQLALKWARHGSNQAIKVTDDFTRLTLDTIALCSMDYRFNSYYHDEMHPFVDAMASFLIESGTRSRRAPLPGFMYSKVDRKFHEDIKVLRETAEGVLKSRKEHPSERKDLLTAMLDGVDPKTGQKLSDDSIIDNLITFLIAGHETTSGLLSFAFYQLLKNPETYRKAQKEVDDVCGKGPVKLEHMNKLPYIAAVLRETLRLSPTIPMIGVESKEDTIIGGKYEIPKGQPFALLFSKSHLDPAVFGDTAHDFLPERMLDENFERLNKEFPDFWKPFGNGMRACIGRPFAWQEALLVMAICLQNFNFMPEDPNYTLQYKQTLTTKPKDFYMRAMLRDGMSALDLERRLKGELVAPKPSTQGHVSGQPKKSGEGKPISIYYGSNTGTCETFAQRLATDAEAHGFTATIVDSLDAANQNLPKDRPVIFITASYEGQPPDNAALFVGWLESLTGNELEGVQYAVFGCGHHDWAQTFHRIPKLVDNTVSERGGDRICSLGLADAAKGEMFTDFEQWEDEVFWPAMEEKYQVSKEDDTEALFQSGITVNFSKPRSSTLRQDVQEAVVVDAKTITAPGAPPKRHIEMQLSSDSGAYRAGDYLAVLPINPKETVNRVMRRFQLAWDTNITIEASRQTTTLPTGVPVPVYDVLGAYVELSQPATKKNILALAEAADDAETKATLRQLAGPDYTEKITSRRVSILDLLEQFPAIPLPFSSFLSLLPPMRVRQYSISSSPLWNRSHVTLTYSILETPSLSNPDKKHLGVATSYLASLEAGDKLNVSVRPSHKAFHLPVDADKTPLIMVAAGSGLAPFRGFVQERAAQIAAGRSLAPAVLFYGCRHPDQDDLYRDEFDKWESIGAVSVRRAFSRCPDSEETKGCKYVGDRIWEDREELAGLWDRGAKVYVCGSREVGESVKKVVVRIAVERQKMIVEAREKGELEKLEGLVEGLKLHGLKVEEVEVSEERALKWFEGVRNERYATDVFD
ncbi:putative bifunctional P-450:NADPH-P450 reductase [Neurospora tetraspora]|uniref:Bifunctional cytochrome P450/NADPH--P450 reductase n=1 Tax=Neurospora tetraspora TaxID=94610 RepID=A0AAE0MPE9_9PEZI|nr:putative bifunctional P-450:NADPH-P450 reductase [Neurospora tetraspora]